jgi:hypothetical protein
MVATIQPQITDTDKKEMEKERMKDYQPKEYRRKK